MRLANNPPGVPAFPVQKSAAFRDGWFMCFEDPEVEQEYLAMTTEKNWKILPKLWFLSTFGTSFLLLGGLLRGSSGPTHKQATGQATQMDEAWFRNSTINLGIERAVSYLKNPGHTQPLKVPIDTDLIQDIQEELAKLFFLSYTTVNEDEKEGTKVLRDYYSNFKEVLEPLFYETASLRRTFEDICANANVNADKVNAK